MSKDYWRTSSRRGKIWRLIAAVLIAGVGAMICAGCLSSVLG